MASIPAQASQPEPSGQWVSTLGRHRKLLVAAVVLAVVFGYFAFNAFANATLYYLTVDEAVAQRSELEGQTFQVKGRLAPQSFVRQEGSTLAHFTLQENGAQLEASYDGVLPDLFFNEHTEVVLLGQLEPSGNFLTEQVLVKCPSKYQAYDPSTEQSTQQ